MAAKVPGLYAMFTGIITNLGKLKGKRSPGLRSGHSGSWVKNGSVFIFNADRSFVRRLKQGGSVAVNGVCLTIFSKQNKSFSVEIMPETQKRTMLGNLKQNDLVNLELPATPNEFLSGHLVYGHIDGTARLVNVVKRENSRILKFSTPASFSSYIAAKGSIAVNGISLTVIDTAKNYFTVGIIPYTWENTMLPQIRINDAVNIEVDILAKYVENFLQQKKYYETG